MDELLTKYLMSVLESTLVSAASSSWPGDVLYLETMGVVLECVVLSMRKRGKIQNGVLHKWWAGAVDKTGNGRSEGRYTYSE